MGIVGLKPFTYAFKQIKVETLNQLSQEYPVESPEYREQLEKDLIYVCTFGLDDELRPEVPQNVQHIRYGETDDSSVFKNNQVNVRMITGDHIGTAKNVAVQAGIIEQGDVEVEEVSMTGEAFRSKIGKYEKKFDPFTKEYFI